MAMPARQIHEPSQFAAKRASRVPFYVPLFNPIARRLLRRGMPMGPNALLTVRGRTTGLDRTTPVAVVAIAGRRWVIGTFGEVNWVRNLRAAGEATLTINRRPEAVQALELSPLEAAGFFKDVIAPYVARVPLGRFVLGTMLGAKEMLTDPDKAAQHTPVFELHPRASAGSGAEPPRQA
jgi:deazaflavin-dependent oxidoreductase (nitroreductase family)